jgi:CRISPR-associated protein Cmr2
MSHLLAISVGPVQEFIAAARRTRDLWFGSYLLSEISREVAQELAKHGSLIFPASLDAENVANVILAELPAEEPSKVAENARQAAKECWERFAKQARKDAGNAIVDDIWNDQIGDVIEFYAAWVKRSSSYANDRKKLKRLLDGRKNLRDFKAAKGRAGVPKSSLDGQRETVLRDGDRTTWPKKLRLSTGEQLDVVGVTKRVGKQKGESDPRYPSVARVAAETWLAGMEKRNALQPLKDACQKLVAKGLNMVREEKYAYFPYEGTVIYKNRLTDLQKELGLQKSDLTEIKVALDELGGEPNPYLAVLVADGDKMGAAISALTSPDANREFSSTLAKFASSARTIVNQHSGVLVYAGGDDMLAFLPVDQCLSCARKLHDDFGQRLAKYGNPTLSVGIAIGHFMENLEDLLDYGRAAEKAAKQVEGKDALAVHLHKRGGAPIKIAARWDTQPEERLHTFAQLMNEGIIPTKLPYELRAMAKLYESPSWAENADAAIQQDLYRLIAKKTSRGSGTVRQALSEFVKEMNSGKLMTLASELLVAHQLATAIWQAAGRSVAAEEVTS